MSAFIMRSRGSRVVWGCLARPVDPHLVVDLHLWRGAESHADLAQKQHHQTAVMLTGRPARVFVNQQMNEFGELDIGARRQCRQAFSIEPRHSLFDRGGVRPPLRNRKFARLSAGGNWIRNFSSALPSVV